MAIQRKDIVNDKVLDIGQDYAKSLQPAIESNLQWLRTFDQIKASALEYAGIEKEFKVSKGRKEFLDIKIKEADLQKRTANALKAENDALLKLEAVEKKRLDIKAKEIDIANKKLTLQRKEENALKRKTTLSDQERVEAQQRNKQARQLAIISSRLSTAYERESARLVLLTRKYKDAAIQYGKNSKEARRFQAQLTALRSKLFEVDKAAGNFQRNVGNYPRAFGGAISSIKQLASAAGLIGGAFLAFQVARDATRTIIEFDRQLIAVRKTTNLTRPELKEFAKDVVALGLSLDGISIKGLLNSSEIAGQLGIRGSENILKFSTTLEQLKLTSDIAGDEAARNFAKFIEVSNDSVENADRLGSVITELGNNFATTESQILKNTTEIQKGISIYNASAESVIGLGAATNALGNEAEASRGALQTVFKVLNDGATTGKNLEQILSLTGQTAGEFRREFAENSVETFRRFVKGLSDSDKEGKNLSNTLTSLGITEKRATTVVGSLAKNYDTLQDALTIANNEYRDNQALTTEAELAAESLEANIDDLSDAWDALVLSVESGNGPISRAFKGLIGFLEDIIKGFLLLNKSQEELNNERFTETLSRQADRYKELGEESKIFAKIDSDLAKNRLRNLEEQRDKQQEVLDKFKEYNGFQKLIRPEARNAQNAIDRLNRSITVQKAIIEAANIELSASTKTTEENTDVKGDEIEKTKEQIAEEKRLAREREKAAKALARRRALERRNRFNLASFDLNQQIQEQDAIVKNQDEFFFERQQALESRYGLELQLARLNAENKLQELETLNQKEIDALLSKNKLTEEEEKRLTDAQLLIFRQFQAEKKKLLENTENEADDINVEQIQRQAEAEKAIREKALNDELTAENELFLAKEGIYAGEVDAVELREKRIAEIKRKYALEGLNAQVAALEELIAKSGEGGRKRIEAERQLAIVEGQISDLTVEKFISNNKKRVDNEKLTNEEILQISANLANAIAELGNAIFAGRIQRIDDELAAQDERYERLLANELLTEQQREQLEQKREADRQKLEKKKREEQRKQAILAKATTALTIGLQTAAAIIAALAPPPIGLGPVAGIPLSVAVGTIGAIQLAAALASPIPQYFKGTENAPEGWALVDELRPEVHTDKYGNIKSLGQKGPNLRYLDHGDKIYKSHEHYKKSPDYEKLFRASMLASVDIDNNRLNSYHAKVSVENNYDELVNEMKLTRQVIKKQKQAIHINMPKIDIPHEIWAAKNRRWNG